MAPHGIGETGINKRLPGCYNPDEIPPGAGCAAFPGMVRKIPEPGHTHHSRALSRAPERRTQEPRRLMPSKIPENASSCPYLTVAGASYPHQYASSRARCQAGATARVVPVRRQTTLCLGPEYGRCPEYMRFSLMEEPEEELEHEGWWSSLRSFDAGFAGRALVSLIAGIIVLAFFAMAPRTMPPSGAVQPDATQTVAGDASGVENSSSTDATPAANPSPVPSSTPVPPTPTPARALAPSPTRSTAQTYLVKPGDTLYSIARAHNVTIEALSKVNDLSDPKRLRAGQRLQIP